MSDLKVEGLHQAQVSGGPFLLSYCNGHLVTYINLSVF